MLDVVPFEIDIPEAELVELRRRLAATRWPPEIAARPGSGIDRGYLRGVLDAWAHTFDWRAQERLLNALPHARAVVDGQRIHFVEVAGVGPSPMPLVITHGWPSTFAEYWHVLGPLTDPAAHGGDPADAFTVVLPSIPGYGFSDPPGETGTSPKRIAALWTRLMAGLGYERYGAAGCDWGATITTAMGALFPDPLVGIHHGMVAVGGARRPDEEPFDDSAWKRRQIAWRALEGGYQEQQGTKPETLGVGLSDSPAGLAGWIAEKWSAWSDHAGDPFEAIDGDDLLTCLSIYWFTGSIGSSIRLYEEHRRDPLVLSDRIAVPAGFLLSPSGKALPGHPGQLAPLAGPPHPTRAARAYDVHRWTVPERGQHFPALEIPDVYVHELREFFRPLR
jgi:pimeloyl-ACP methyl ester carboxylesterase